VRYRELALADLEQIFQYLDERSPAGARNVIEAFVRRSAMPQTNR
jgi:plasmid stabilization system protein ParE